MQFRTNWITVWLDPFRCVVNCVFVYPSNTTNENTLSCARLHVSTSGSHHLALLNFQSIPTLVLHHCNSRFYVLRKAWWRLPEVETCSLAQVNVFSLVVLDGLYKYTDESMCFGVPTEVAHTYCHFTHTRFNSTILDISCKNVTKTVHFIISINNQQHRACTERGQQPCSRTA
jgi:hypothetical protein